jgi:hypothetical protein
VTCYNKSLSCGLLVCLFIFSRGECAPRVTVSPVKTRGVFVYVHVLYLSGPLRGQVPLAEMFIDPIRLTQPGRLSKRMPVHSTTPRPI